MSFHHADYVTEDAALFDFETMVRVSVDGVSLKITCSNILSSIILPLCAYNGTWFRYKLSGALIHRYRLVNFII